VLPGFQKKKKKLPDWGGEPFLSTNGNTNLQNGDRRRLGGGGEGGGGFTIFPGCGGGKGGGGGKKGKKMKEENPWDGQSAAVIM